MEKFAQLARSAISVSYGSHIPTYEDYDLYTFSSSKAVPYAIAKRQLASPAYLATLTFPAASPRSQIRTSLELRTSTAAYPAVAKEGG